MSNGMRFCAACGRPIDAGVRFCPHCGAPAVAPVPPGPPAGAPAAASAAPAVRPKRRPNVLLILVGLLLLVVSAMQPAALLFGVSAPAVVTSVDRVRSATSDATDYDYRIAYRFAIGEGKSQEGSYSRSNVYDVSDLPEEGSGLTISYIPALPFVNGPAGRADAGLATLVSGGIGLLVLVLGITGAATVGRRRQRS